MNLIEQLINLALNDELAKRYLADSQRIIVSHTPLNFTRMTITNDVDKVRVNTCMYTFTGPIITLTRSLINGEENLKGFIELTESLKDRFTDDHLEHGWNVYLADRLKYLRTVERLELNTGKLNPLNIKPDDRREAVFQPSKEDQIIELLTDIRDLLGTIRDEKQSDRD